VADTGNNRVVVLTPDLNQRELPITGLDHPVGVAVDDSGSVYVSDSGNNRVVKLPAK
jgi:serine/threonine-protein kinase